MKTLPLTAFSAWLFVAAGFAGESPEAAVERMKRIVMPEVRFEQASLPDVMAFLQQASTPGTNGVGFNFLIKPVTNGPPVPPITFAARHITLYDTLRTVCDLGDLKWSVRSTYILIEPDDRRRVVPKK